MQVVYPGDGLQSGLLLAGQQPGLRRFPAAPLQKAGASARGVLAEAEEKTAPPRSSREASSVRSQGLAEALPSDQESPVVSGPVLSQGDHHKILHSFSKHLPLWYVKVPLKVLLEAWVSSTMNS